ncbi:MAG: glycosyltransferase family 2 protein [Candidatus Weimeria sp.]
MDKTDDILVSVICTAYNQKKYIARCLDGFVMQQADFRYEVLIHDDCSTDGTLEIILDYEKKYPDIFTVVTESENVYSKGADIYDDIMVPLVHGRYIALCEGDDYWCDEHKLQKQADFMEEHPECSLVCHNTIVHDLSGSEPDKLFNNWNDVHQMSEDEVFMDWKVHTSSYLFRKQFFGRRDFERRFRIFGDYIELCNAMDCGQVYALPEVMSVYNFRNSDGLTVAEGQDSSNTLQQISDRIEFLKEYDGYTDHRHSPVILKKITAMADIIRNALINVSDHQD